MNGRTATVFSLAFLFGPVRAEASPLKNAFEVARLAGDIERVLPVFRAADLYVVAASARPPT